jgi:superfamily I DNA/RNA helicase
MEPDRHLIDEESEITERSLFYVAATRAKRKVLITSYEKK